MTDVTRYLDGRTLILLSNREPYEHLAGSEGVHVRQPPGCIGNWSVLMERYHVDGRASLAHDPAKPVRDRLLPVEDVERF